ncbi:MAG: hypothetical protein ABI556_13355, partial [Gemmatimonadales bacterium]
QAPTSVHAGRVAFRFVNKGTKQHEMSVVELKKGVSLDQFAKIVRSKQTIRPLIEGPVGITFADPGKSSPSLVVAWVKPGATLALICLFRDSAEAPSHADMGMYASVVANSAGAVAQLPATSVDTIIATEYALRYPRQLAAGKHTFAFRNDGKMRHEVNVSMLAPGVTLARLLAADKAGEKVDSLFAGDIGVLHVYGGESARGELTFDVLPGREYLVACYFQDDDKAPEHYRLGMYGSIRGLEAPKTTQ